MRALLVILFATAFLNGCVTREGARREAQKTLFQEQQRAEFEKQQKEPAVWFRGDIRHPRVPWQEGLGLVEALATAQYTWNWDPRVLTITRDGQIYTVNVRRLLRGQENPELEPGDIIDVRH
jgi:hypothetical protein